LRLCLPTHPNAAEAGLNHAGQNTVALSVNGGPAEPGGNVSSA
jgi:hypothetical protein